MDVINEDEEVITHASNLEIHQKRLLHKSVHILIIDSLGRIYLRLRTPEQGTIGAWIPSAGAHVLSGQTYNQTAKKALQDVLGASCPLILIGKVRITSETEKEIVAVYTGYCDAVKLNPDLKQTGRFFTVEDIKHLFETQRAAPHLVESFNLYLKNN